MSDMLAVLRLLRISSSSLTDASLAGAGIAEADGAAEGGADAAAQMGAASSRPPHAGA